MEMWATVTLKFSFTSYFMWSCCIDAKFVVRLVTLFTNRTTSTSKAQEIILTKLDQYPITPNMVLVTFLS